MNFDLAILERGMLQEYAVEEIMNCNDVTESYGLTLSRTQAAALCEVRNKALTDNGRIEVGGGIFDKLINEFCDSSYISQHNYVDVMADLAEMFYYFKNESLDSISDDELIHYMGVSFNGVCQGDTDLLAGKILSDMARRLRFGHDFECCDELEDDEDGQY